jgi:hypothetical protein
LWAGATNMLLALSCRVSGGDCLVYWVLLQPRPPSPAAPVNAGNCCWCILLLLPGIQGACLCGSSTTSYGLTATHQGTYCLVHTFLTLRGPQRPLLAVASSGQHLKPWPQTTACCGLLGKLLPPRQAAESLFLPAELGQWGKKMHAHSCMF